MQQRKIQMIAGSTYTVSLPKGWVQKNRLNQGSSVFVDESSDGCLKITPSNTNKIAAKESDSITLDVDDYGQNINQVLFATYYIGAEKIRIISKKGIDMHMRNQIKAIVNYMSGTEIMYEDMNTIKIKVLLDKSKIEINQILFRVGLIISSSLKNISDREHLNIEDIRRNEEEVDRLYHLLAKLVHMPIHDISTLGSTGVQNSVHILPYFMFCKRLENIADTVYEIAQYIHENNLYPENLSTCLNEVDQKLNNYLTLLLSKKENIFESIGGDDLLDLKKTILMLRDNSLARYILNLLRYIADLKEELIHISYYRKLINENIL